MAETIEVDVETVRAWRKAAGRMEVALINVKIQRTDDLSRIAADALDDIKGTPDFPHLPGDMYSSDDSMLDPDKLCLGVASHIAEYFGPKCTDPKCNCNTCVMWQSLDTIKTGFEMGGPFDERETSL